MISLEECAATLKSPTKDTWSKHASLFTLRTIGGEEASKTLEDSYPYFGTSELLRHECMYVMGQMREKNSFDFLVKTMNDPEEFGIVRHEAGEALANYHHMKEEAIKEMEKHLESEISVLKSTVIVGIGKLRDFKEENRYGKKYNGTIEPAEPFNEEEMREYLETVEGLEKQEDPVEAAR